MDLLRDVTAEDGNMVLTCLLVSAAAAACPDFLEDDGTALEVSANRCGVFNSSSSCWTTRGSQEANFRNESLQRSRVVFLCFVFAKEDRILLFELEGILINFCNDKHSK